MNIDLLLKNIQKEFDSIDDICIEDCDASSVVIVENKEDFIDIDDPGRHTDATLAIEINPSNDFEYSIYATYDDSDGIIFTRSGYGLDKLLSCLEYLISNNKEDSPWLSFDIIYKILNKLGG